MLKRDHSFIVNGDNIISDSGIYKAAGAVFDYRRIDDAIDTSDENTEGVTEWITATGPIREAVHLMVSIAFSCYFSKCPHVFFIWIFFIFTVSIRC